MHTRMTVAQVQPERFDEAVAAVQEAFLPAAREQPGYRGFLLLSDRTTQQLVGISVGETEADLQTSGGGGGRAGGRGQAIDRRQRIGGRRRTGRIEGPFATTSRTRSNVRTRPPTRRNRRGAPMPRSCGASWS